MSGEAIPLFTFLEFSALTTAAAAASSSISAFTALIFTLLCHFSKAPFASDIQLPMEKEDCTANN